jgi:hypothetical protein
MKVGCRAGCQLIETMIDGAESRDEGEARHGRPIEPKCGVRILQGRFSELLRPNLKNGTSVRRRIEKHFSCPSPTEPLPEKFPCRVREGPHDHGCPPR